MAGALEQDHWAREIAQRGPLATFEASQALWEHMLEGALDRRDLLSELDRMLALARRAGTPRPA